MALFIFIYATTTRDLVAIQLQSGGVKHTASPECLNVLSRHDENAKYDSFN